MLRCLFFTIIFFAAIPCYAQDTLKQNTDLIDAYRHLNYGITVIGPTREKEINNDSLYALLQYEKYNSLKAQLKEIVYSIDTLIHHALTEIDSVSNMDDMDLYASSKVMYKYNRTVNLKTGLLRYNDFISKNFDSLQRDTLYLKSFDVSRPNWETASFERVPAIAGKTLLQSFYLYMLKQDERTILNYWLKNQ